ncbi:MAG TPA: citrate lyase holo-[acyl-carrier protein] synthase [Acholeplasmataceae bacterium]|nr:citrate lyase holo-[acyl-carrier protein] synthase [Acholeplasmataceae bacterium]
MTDSILDAREKRAFLLSYMLSKGYDAVISIRANIPGIHKNSPEAYVVVRYFESMIKHEIGYIHLERLDGEDGPYVLLSVQADDLQALKKSLIDIEDGQPIGRLVDVDLWHIDGSISRRDLGYPSRRCYLCDREAHHCARNRTHPLSETLAFVEETVKHHLEEDLKKLAKQAMMSELNLEDKFGLVTPSHQGSHHDMNYELMIKAQDAIIPYMIELFNLGASGLEHYRLMEQGRKIGLQAEHAMYEVTEGINCYKGLIFILGLVMLSSGYVIKHKLDFNHIFLTIQLLAKPILEDFEKNPITFGEKAYHEHQIMGARGEASLGLPSVHHALRLIEGQEITDTRLREILQLLIRSTDDTVLLKRAGSFETYMEIKKKVASLDVTDIDEVKRFSQEAIDHRWSFGGSADLLIATLFIHELGIRYF